ncbi:MFS transporter [Amycolatopsis sp. BJA-103]|uniref:MFS transporter n=1 Tax=Amycolatopsis sp. BJA-103 TaxID=1911175 RepID=UPI000CB355CC|nr:MFS transporter [Amycolatopsis sp. BJA-103]PNE14918.1 MFS transporter [Amycolatopsis sp. BJA-103]
MSTPVTTAVPATIRRLLVGRSLSLLGTAMIPTALILAIIEATDSGTAVGVVLACELIPQLLLLPIGGVIADRLRPQRLAFAADVVRGLVQLAIGVELLLGSMQILHLAILSAIAGAAIAIGTPTMSPLVIATVPERDRLRVNGQLGMARGLALVVGPGVVGLLIVTVGAGWLFVVIAAVFFAGGALLGGLRTAARPARSKEATFVRDLVEGWTEVRKRRWFWTNLLGHGVSNLTAGIFMTLGPLIAIRVLGGEISWVIIYQCGMVGMIIGSFLAPRLPIARPLIATSLGGAVFALPLAAFAIPGPVWLNAAAYFVAMLGLGILNTLWQTVMQQQFPPQTLARADSYDALLSFAARPLGLALAAPVAMMTSESTVLIFAAVLVGGFNVALLALPDVRRMPLRSAPETAVAVPVEMPTTAQATDTEKTSPRSSA